MNNRLFEEIYYEFNADKANQKLAKKTVKINQKVAQQQQNFNNATKNTDAAKNALSILQAIANEQKQFDADTIKSLMNDINALDIGNDVKKSINHILNNQNAALNNNQTNSDKSAEQNPTNEKQQNLASGVANIQLIYNGKDYSNKFKELLINNKVTKQQVIDWVSEFLE